MARWDWYVHGLWILGSLFAFFGALLAGNLSWIEGTNIVSFTLAVVISFLLVLVAGLMWISAGANAVQHELDPPAERKQKEVFVQLRPVMPQRAHPHEERPRQGSGKHHHFMDSKSRYIKF